MKRRKYKIFKRRSDLIKYAIKRAIHSSVAEAEAHAKRVAEHLKKTDWLTWARQRLK